MNAWLINVPITLMGWVEATTCGQFLVNYGGHVWYDATIPVSLCVYFVAARAHAARIQAQ